MTTERQEIEKAIGSAAGYRRGSEPIGNIIAWLQSVVEEGATHLEFSASMGYDNEVDMINIQPIMIYTESEEQAEIRVRNEESERIKYNAIRNAQNKAEYERLKKIYG